MTGSGAELMVTNPDGSVEVSRPSGVSPPASPPRAGETGREPAIEHRSEPGHPDIRTTAPSATKPEPTDIEPTSPPWATEPEQLTLA